MKNYVLILIAAGLFTACEQKETTVNPPAENNTTIVNPSPATKTEKTEKTETNTAPGSETKTETETKTTSSPSP
jgi:hypothetical protein